jgi:hypothetical protein
MLRAFKYAVVAVLLFTAGTPASSQSINADIAAFFKAYDLRLQGVAYEIVPGESKPGVTECDWKPVMKLGSAQ